MVFIDATISLGNVLGSLVSSYLILLIGNVNLLLVTACLHVLAYAFTNVYVRESLVGALEVRNIVILLNIFVMQNKHGHAKKI